MFFSIVIPVYNKEKEVQKCLDTALSQTFKDIEIVLVDDGSNDASVEIIQEYINRDARVRLIKNGTNKSLLYSRMAGMREAKGKYVLLVDADDYLEQNACHILYNELKRNSVDILEFQFVREPFGQKGPWPDVMPKDVAESIITGGYNYNVWHRCYSHDLVMKMLAKTTPFYCNMAEDGFFSVVFASLAESYNRIPDCLYHYVTGTGMSTNNYHDEAQVRAAVNSMQAKTEELRVFLNNNRPDLAKYVESFYQNDLKKVVQLCTKDSVPLERQIQLLRYMDSLCKTGFEKRRNEELLEAFRKVKAYQESNIRGKAKLLTIAFRRDVIRKLARKVMRKK